MSASDWIVCERTGRWAAALRVGAIRNGMMLSREPRIFEVRTLEELAERLDAGRAGLALLEVHPSNIAKLLPWLADYTRRFPRAHFVALVDRLPGVEVIHDNKRPADDPHNLVGALLEAGVAEIVTSPRGLQPIFALAERSAAVVRRPPRKSDAAQSITEWAWSRLPWQTDRR
jgi:hypothetical protein